MEGRQDYLKENVAWQIETYNVATDGIKETWGLGRCKERQWPGRAELPGQEDEVSPECSDAAIAVKDSHIIVVHFSYVNPSKTIIHLLHWWNTIEQT